MKLNLYSIFDAAVGAYQRPFCAQSDGEAVRAFSDLAVAADHPVGQHPKDYSLYRVGTFSDQTGQVDPEPGECLATAIELAAQARTVNPSQTDLEEHLNGQIGNGA